MEDDDNDEEGGDYDEVGGITRVMTMREMITITFRGIATVTRTGKR